MIYVQAEVILANLLSCNNFVNGRDIRDYCEAAQKALKKETGEEALFEMNDEAVERAVCAYKDAFLRFGDRYFTPKGRAVKPDYFNDRLTNKRVEEVLKDMAENIKEEEK